MYNLQKVTNNRSIPNNVYGIPMFCQPIVRITLPSHTADILRPMNGSILKSMWVLLHFAHTSFSNFFLILNVIL
jgi:hypothetical protein